MSSFNNPEAESQRSYAHAALNYKTQRETARNLFECFCLRDIVNEIPLNLEKTTSCVLLVYVINL